MRGYCLAVRIGGLLIVALLGGLIVVPIACSNGTSKSGSGGTALDMKEIDKSKDTSKAQMGAGANDPDQKKYMKNGGDTGKAPDLRLPPSADAAPRPGNDHNAKLNAPPADEPLAATTGGGRSPLSGKGDPKSERRPDQPPQVWHRDAQRPTFARVYVGDRNSLELVSLHVTVTIEGPRRAHPGRSRLPQSARSTAGRHLRVSAADRSESVVFCDVPRPNARHDPAALGPARQCRCRRRPLSKT